VLLLPAQTLMPVLSVLLLLAWMATLMFFFRYRRRSSRKIHKLLGRLAVKNHQSARALIEREEKFRKLISHMNEGLLLTDAGHRILFANQSACGILNVAPELVNGRLLSDFAAGPTEAARINAALDKKRRGCHSREEVQLIRSRNDMFWASLSISYPNDLKEITGGAMIVLVDISGQKSAEQKLQRLTTGLVQKVRQLNCVFDIQELATIPGISTERLFREALKIIPGGLLHAEDASIEIVFRNQRFATPGYRVTGCACSLPLKVNGLREGQITVCYPDRLLYRVKNPFRVGQKVLLRNIAGKLGQAVTVNQLMAAGPGGGPPLT